MIRPSSELPVTSITIDNRAEVKVSARIEAASYRTAAPVAAASDSRASASAAAASMPSLTRRARLTVTPSPRPGKMSALLAWATWYSTPR